MLAKLKKAAAFLDGFQVPTYAASASFFMILSIFPLLALVLALLRYLPIGPVDLLQILANVLPAALLPIVEYLVSDLYSVNLMAILSVTILATIWSASRGVYEIQTGITRIMGAPEHRSYLRRRLSAIFYMFLLILALFMTLALQVFGKRLIHALAGWSPRIYAMVSELVRLRFLFTTAVLALLFMMIFAFFPAKKMSLHDVVPGALMTSVGWLAFSSLFSIYVNHQGASHLYGSLTMAVLAMLWLYICMSILFYGAVICLLTQSDRLNLRAAKAFFGKSSAKK